MKSKSKSSLILIYFHFYLKGRQRRSSMYWFTLQMPVSQGLAGGSHSMRLTPGWPHGSQRPENKSCHLPLPCVCITMQQSVMKCGHLDTL